MALNVPADVYERAVAHLRDGSIIFAVAELHKAGIGIADAKRWCEELSASADPAEAAVGREFEAARRLRDEEAGLVPPDAGETRATSAPPAQPSAAAGTRPLSPYEDLNALADALKMDIPGVALDDALDELLSMKNVADPQPAHLRAAHLCRLSNSFCLMWRNGECSQAEARTVLRSGAPGFSLTSYQRAWENAVEVTREG